MNVQIRLLGLGAVACRCRRERDPVAGAAVELRRGSFPGERLQGATDAQGRVRFVNVSEGPFSIEATEAITGLTGRASGTAVRDAEVAAPVTITPSGRVTGTFLTADGQRPIPIRADHPERRRRAGLRDDGHERPVRARARSPSARSASRRGSRRTAGCGRASGQFIAEGQSVDVTVLQLPRGDGVGVRHERRRRHTCRRRVGEDPIGQLRAHGVCWRLAARWQLPLRGYPGRRFTMEAEDPVTGAKGTVQGSLAQRARVSTQRHARAVRLGARDGA